MFALKLFRNSFSYSLGSFTALRTHDFCFLQILVIFFEKFSLFEKFLKIPFFHRTWQIYVFCALKTRINQTYWGGGVSRGLRRKNLATISKIAVKLNKNGHILAKVGQNVPYSTSLGLKTNFNQLSTSKHIGIEYQIIFLAFSEV